MSSKKFMIVVLGLALIAAMGCSRNKQPQTVPAGTAVAPSQPYVNAAAPAPATHRTSTYLK